MINNRDENERQRIRQDNLEMEVRRQQWNRIGRNVPTGTHQPSTAPAATTSTPSTSTSVNPAATTHPTTTPTPVIQDLSEIRNYIDGLPATPIKRKLVKPFDKPGHGIKINQGNYNYRR